MRRLLTCLLLALSFALKADTDLEKAAEYADKAIRIDPGKASYHLLRGNAGIAGGGTAKAGTFAEETQVVDASQGHYMKGRILQREKKPGPAEHFRKQAELDPENPNSWDSLGDGLIAKGKLDEAIAAYRKALERNPVFVSSLRSLGKALEQSGRREEAIQHYRQCAQLGVQKGIPEMTKESRERLAALGVRD